MTESEITRDAERLRAIAAQCKTLHDFWRKVGWSDFQSVLRANDILKLGLTTTKKTAAPLKAKAKK